MKSRNAEVVNVITNKSLLSKLVNDARKYIDGQGAVRIFRLIAERIETENE